MRGTRPEDGTNIAPEFPRIGLADEFYRYEESVDGVDIIEFKDRVVGAGIDGTRYDFSNFTYVMKARMHVFPNDIGANCAKIVMLASDAD